ncbi:MULTISPECIES: PAS domain S-box protein [unclassified Mesorhizobium]|uniref:PAS domain S-box protein n=1 Tax=unclassified Mesorhizobium TaxID=325217 RepID=UPI001128A0C1|nr:MULTISPECIES: PAS domain S-box protein [unclassified Mesorhizobium]MBZ9701699.1 PAS domain S-box protein [Mesorhizobium sp. CO1-1-3]MBZ9949047.1 PAS domain S-box protein [Mesorhizobium sp. BR1-1-11]TPI99737.1 PAS domain S-box protein [Mesorhizobium sp. B2-8-1]TPJ46123.1 PAS domain S-box protein [Mesorhizobium sp. B2-6-4]
MKQGGLPARLDEVASFSERSRERQLPDPILSDEFEDFFENAAIALHFVGKDGTILRANRAELEMLGFTAEEYVGRNIREFHADQVAIGDILDRLSRREELKNYRARLRAKDGSIRWVEITSNVRLVGDRFLNTRCITIDVTETVKAQELIREQERRLAITYENAAAGIVEANAEGQLLRVNSHLCDLLGCTQDELIGRSIFDRTFPADVEADREQYRRQVAGEIDSYTLEKRFVSKNGSVFWAVVTSTSVHDCEGSFRYAVRVQHDISERKRIEAALAKRAEEQGAIHRFTEMLQHARTQEDVYEPALDAIQRALQCQRASILLLDKDGRMKFVAWRGLSDTYRLAVEGHSPWSTESQEPQPICVGDAKHADLPEQLKQAIRSEGIGAVYFIPITQGGRLLGKFMAYFDQPQEYSEEQIELGRTIARQLGFGIQRIKGENAAQRLAAIVESSHDAIVSKDLNGIILTWNRGAERLFGYAASEVLGEPITIIIPPERLQEEPLILGRIRKGEIVDHFETVRRRKDGSLVDISLTISPVRDAAGRIVGASKIARDITEQKVAEAKVRDSERHLQDLLAAIPAAIYTTDENGKITYFNAAAVELAGRTPVIGSDEWCVTWKLYWPDGRPLPHDQCPMAVSLREGRPVRGVEAIAERPDGTRIPFIPYPTPMRNAAGEIVGGINMLVDVSERKQAETQQRILLNELNHRVKNNMMMLKSLLSVAARASQNPEARKTIEEASKRVATMAAAQRVLYDTPDASNFSAPLFVEAICETTKQMFPANVQLVCDADPIQLPNDIAMPLALIVNELLVNAVKHGSAAKGSSTIRVGIKRNGQKQVLTVEDAGPGFDLKAVRHSSSGLRLVEGLARQIGGIFEVEPDPSRCIVVFSQAPGENGVELKNGNS